MYTQKSNLSSWQQKMKRERLDFWGECLIGIFVTALLLSPGIMHLAGIDPNIVYEFDFGIRELLQRS